MIHGVELKKIMDVNTNANMEGEVFKAGQLAHFSGLHFRQNSMTGEITVSRSKREIRLNADLH